MNKLVIVRHGESTWNQENRFTGWTDVDLSEKGRLEAREGGEVLKKEGYTLTFTAVSIFLATVALFPVWFPALEATRADSVRALRSE